MSASEQSATRWSGWCCCRHCCRREHDRPASCVCEDDRCHQRVRHHREE
uniref:Uncharacterized protein n=1 Tax=Arundo donax TaxID=35708 RepID=A0A0A9BE51_ARUDO